MNEFFASISWHRLKALCYKETLQILRDPSSNIIAFILPVVMLFIFGYAINLDSNAIKVGLLMEDTSPEARQFADSLFGSKYMRICSSPNRRDLEQRLTNGRIRGFIIVPQDFSEKLQRPGSIAPIQVVTDGAEPNIARFVENYARGAWLHWQMQRALARGENASPRIDLQPRFWFNPSAESRNYLIPGSITIIMTVIGALLTSLVVAREWERGTMEALLATPITRAELLLSKLIPYYGLGIISLLICVAIAVFVLGVPFRGSIFMLLVVSTFFLLSTLGLGLFLSTTIRNQFNAAQAALNAAFLPALMLSGFIYEIRSMPLPIRLLTRLMPVSYFVTALQTLFQAGDLWGILIPNTLFLVLASAFFLFLTARATRRRLD